MRAGLPETLRPYSIELVEEQPPVNEQGIMPSQGIARPAVFV